MLSQRVYLYWSGGTFAKTQITAILIPNQMSSMYITYSSTAHKRQKMEKKTRVVIKSE